MSRAEYAPVRPAVMEKGLSVPQKHHEDFKAAFESLQKDGSVVIGRGKTAALPPMPKRVKGIFRSNVKGFGFVIPFKPNSHGDLFVPPGFSLNAMTGDTVIAKSTKKGFREGKMSYNGEVVEIIARGRTKIVGTLQKSSSGWLVQPDGKDFTQPVAVDDVTAKNAGHDDKVVVEIITYPAETALARGVIVEVLGRVGLYDAEIRSIIAQYDLPGEFDRDCVDQARKAAESFGPDPETNRDDITSEVVITIDPPDAKDFDDAISLSKNDDGNWVLGVHIADVTAFIPMESPLDVEAKERGNSVYLPGKVIPMLPEILSNGICSLQPEQKRFAKSAYITYDKRGNVLARAFANSIIRSTARLTYEDADKILDGKAAGFAGEVVALVKDMEDLARAIEKRRVKDGMLHLDLPETEVILNEQGKVVDAKPADDSYPHTIIEMFMVEANEAVASLMDRFDMPFMRRIHPEPEPAKTKTLGQFVKICGFKLPRRLDRAAIQDLLDTVKGTSYSFAINIHILKSLQRAEYAPLHVGHFALASKHYCHFTSPIRRYADILVHRLLQCYLEHRLNMIGLEEALPEIVLSEVGEHITFTEQQADKAEKELKTVLILQLLSEHIGDELDCIVSGLTNFGVFAQCTKYGIEGLVAFEDLGLDEWKFDNKHQAVVGRHSGKSVHLGQEMRVRIVSVNVAARQLDLAPVKLLVSGRPRIKVATSQKRRRKGHRHHSKRWS